MTKLIKSLFMALALVFVLSNQANAQMDSWQNKVSWSFEIQKIDDCSAFVVATATLIPGWHIYSVNHDPQKADFTGYPTAFVFAKSDKYKTVGKLIDGAMATEHTDALGLSVYFEGRGVFKQKIEVLTNESFDLKFEYSFQVCDEKGCLFPPDQEKSLKVKGFKPCTAEAATIPVKVDEKTPIETKELPSTVIEEATNDESDTDSKLESTKAVTKKLPIKKESTGMWGIFIAGFIGGLIALLTPCVFPMIPMTVTFFTKQSGTRAKGIINALIYGGAIIAIYVALGLIISAILGPTGLNELSTNVWMNLLFFTIFIIFAVSFLGAFEIRMPSSWVNKADSKADKGGLIGIFFMAFTLSLVSFSCTGPIIGTLLVEASSSGSMMGPAIGMIGFSSALAIPFTLFAIFPGWLNSLPQSGGWLNSVKVVLGLLELALALKFLSAVDLAYHWDILTRELFIAIWTVLFFIMGIYLLGKIRFSHDSPVERLSVTRFMFALAALVFSLYLLPGMFGAPLKIIDGVAPPRTHSEDNFRFVKGNGGAETSSDDPLFNEYRSKMHEVGDGSILVFHDMDLAKEYAQKAELPILIDFTGHACNNCRKTESSVWTDDKIRNTLQKKFVIASLYVDDRTLLPESEWKYSEVIQGKIKTVGNRWSDYQVRKYGQISQPLYIVADSEGNDLTEPIGYTPDVDQYAAFLQKGLDLFNKKK
ncbi:MAG: thiol:disulfide interchange protein [Psychromonas sp.]|jgi:thiol:disulfide interchange protein